MLARTEQISRMLARTEQILTMLAHGALIRECSRTRRRFESCIPWGGNQ